MAGPRVMISGQARIRLSYIPLAGARRMASDSIPLEVRNQKRACVILRLLGTFKIGSLSKDEGNGNENVTRKYISTTFVLLRHYFKSLNFYKNGELSMNQIGRSGVQVKKENEKFNVVHSRSPQNLKCGHFTLLFCRERQRNVPK